MTARSKWARMTATGAFALVAALIAAVVIPAAPAAAAPGDVLYRVNAGGPELPALDGGPVWGADTRTAKSPYLVTAGSNRTLAVSSAPDSSVPATTPAGIWQTERYDTRSTMNYAFPVPTGTRVEVRLFVANGYAGTNDPGDRVFDILVDGTTPPELAGIDLAGRFGHAVGHMFTVPVISDGTVNVAFAAIADNPLINAIEIVEAAPMGGVLHADPSAVDLGEVVVGSAPSVATVGLFNTGVTGHPVITIDQVTVTPDGPFAVAGPTAAQVAAGESTALEVSFDPSSAGAHAATATVAYSSASGPGELEIALTGTAVAPTPIAEALVGPGELAFPDTLAAGGVSHAALSLENVGLPGEGVITLTDVDVSDAQFTVGALPGPIAAGGTASLDVAFDPSSVGPASATVTVEYARGTETGYVTVALTGMGSATPVPVGMPVHRINVGGPAVPAADGSALGWAADTAANPSPFRLSGSAHIYTTSSSQAYTTPISMAHASVPLSAPASVFQTERYDIASGADMTWGLPVTSGSTYEVRLLFAEIYSGIKSAGKRVFDVSVEGSVPSEFDNIDPFAAAGAAGASARTVEVTAADSTLNLGFIRGLENPSLKGIEVIDLTSYAGVLAAAPDTLDFGLVNLRETSDAQTVTVSNLGVQGDPSITILEVDAGGAFAAASGVEGTVVDPGASEQFDVTFSPTSVGVESASLTVTYDGGAGPQTTTVTLEGEGRRALSTGEVLYRVNAGGPQLPAVDGGPAWGADGTSTPSPYLSNPGSNQVLALSAQPDATVPASTPVGIWQSERYDMTDSMTYSFDVPEGTRVEVRLYAANGWGGTSQPGKRVFDISVDGVVPDELDDIDLSARFGHQVGHLFAVPIISDGTVDIGFASSVENAVINAIEIVEADPESGILAPHRTALQWGNVVAGGSGAQQTVRLVNVGGTDAETITIDSVSVDPDTHFSVAAPSTTAVAPGGASELAVTFAPTDSGAHAAELTVEYSSADGQGTIVIPLTGTGTPATGLSSAFRINPPDISFPNVLVDGGSNTASLTLSNLGATGEEGISVTGVTVDDPQFTVGTVPSGAIQPGASAAVPVTFNPSAAGPHEATATVSFARDGETATATVALRGVGVNQFPLSSLAWNQSTLAGEVSQSATTLDWGPDGRLYVAQFDGTIYAYTVARDQGDDYSVPGTYSITATEQIDLVKEIPNHDDDGVAQPANTGRIVLGITVEGTAQSPVIYATSGHPTLNGGDDIDTNSGTLSRLTRSGAGWSHTVLVAGLPRSQHDHMLGGIQIDGEAGVAYVASGGNTNQGARSNNLDQLPEYALGTAVLSVDLDAIDAMATQTVGGVDYKYILPTIESGPNPAPGDMPWGGKEGYNQAMLIQGGPITIHSPGYRNIYDLVRTENGNIFTVDNGPNGGWGTAPHNSYVNGDVTGRGDATWANGKCLDSAYAGGGATKPDQLHRANAGDYGGHPNVTRANPLGLPGTSAPFGAAIPGGWYSDERECVYLPAGTDGGLETFSSSTNGITEYTSSEAFGGALKGALLTASYTGNGQIWAMIPSEDGTYLTTNKVAIFTGFGAFPLDVATQGDDEEFPGLVAAVAYHSTASIVFWEPQSTVTCDTSDPAGDADGDGYSNADEEASGTGACNNGSRPADWDEDLIGDATDPDDDNDGLEDTVDPFPVDADNGVGTPEVELDFAATDNRGGFEGSGLTGLMINATDQGAGAGDDYLDLLNRSDVIWGGTSPLIQINEVKPGDAVGPANTQEDALQVGVDVGATPFRVETTIVNPAFASSDPEHAGAAQNSASQGVFIGDGTQSNFLRFALAYDDGVVIQALSEVGDATAEVHEAPLPAAVDAEYIDLMLDVTPGATEATVVPSYVIDGGAPVAMPAMTVPMSWLEGPSYLASGDPASTMAAGIIATSAGDAEPFNAAWTGLHVTETAPPVDLPDARAVIAVTPGAGINASTYNNNTIRITNASDPEILITGVTFDLSSALLPDLIFDPADPTIAGDLVTVCFQPTTGATATGLTTQLSGGMNCGPDGTPSLNDAFLAPYQAGFQQLRLTFDDFDEADDGAGSYAFGFRVDIDPTSIQGTPSPGPGESGSVSGLELAGSTVTVEFSNGETHVATLFSDGSQGGAVGVAKAGSATAPTLSAIGVGTGPADVTSASQTLTISGASGATYELLHVEAAMFQQSGGGFDVDPFEANSVIATQVATGTLTGGSVQVPVTLTDTHASGGINQFIAVIRDADGDTGAASNRVVLRLP